MKIAAILEGEVIDGGGFNQSLNAILQISKLSKNNFELVVLTTQHHNLKVLSGLGIEARLVTVGLTDKILSKVSTGFFIRKLMQKFRLLGRVEKTCLNEGADLIYFLNPSYLALAFQKLNFVLTIWDMCHRDHPEFAEVHSDGEFNKREQLYRFAIPASYLTITDSNVLSKKISSAYGVSEDRLLAIPFSPAPHLSGQSQSDDSRVLKGFGLEPAYFFYPAQLWPHKNHIRILQALSILKSKGKVVRVAFAGGDRNNGKYLKEQAHNLGVEDQVKFLGFVKAEEMDALFRHCLTVIMPTYFGPTNLPPLEAWTFDKPLIYSNVGQEQAAGAAYIVDPDDATSLASGIESLLNEEIRQQLVLSGRKRLKELAADRETAEIELLNRLLIYKKRRDCWGQMC